MFAPYPVLAGRCFQPSQPRIHSPFHTGGGGRIRTHGGLSTPAVFKTAAIIHLCHASLDLTRRKGRGTIPQGDLLGRSYVFETYAVANYRLTLPLFPYVRVCVWQFGHRKWGRWDSNPLAFQKSFTDFRDPPTSAAPPLSYQCPRPDLNRHAFRPHLLRMGSLPGFITRALEPMTFRLLVHFHNAFGFQSQDAMRNRTLETRKPPWACGRRGLGVESGFPSTSPSPPPA